MSSISQNISNHHGSGAAEMSVCAIDDNGACVEPAVIVTDCDGQDRRLNSKDLELNGKKKQLVSNLTSQLAAAADGRKPSLSLQVPGLTTYCHGSPSSASILSFTSGFINSIQYPTAIIRCSDMQVLHYNDLAMSLFGYGIDELISGQLCFSDLFPSLCDSLQLDRMETLPKLMERRLSSSVSGRGILQSTKTGRHLLSKSHDHTSEEFNRRRHVSNWQASEKPVNQLVKAQLKDGSTVWVELSLSPISNESFQSPILCNNNNESFDIDIEDEEQYLLATIRELSSLETHSRYQNEFIEMEMIGKGGFGTVYKALNKIDGQEYAIKKVHLDSYNGDLSNDKFIREVQTFARISNHPNVVRYYAAWTEPVIRRVSLKPKKSAPLLRSSHLSDGEIDQDLMFVNDALNGSASVGTSPIKTRFRSKSKKLRKASMNFPEMSSFEATVLTESWKQQNEMLSSSFASAKSSVKKIHNEKSSKTKASAILYIQMQFCPYNDLRKWIDGRTVINSQDNLEIVKQILEGLDYIHAQGFVHCDVKPENIFYQDGRVYVGDFGLARSTSIHEHDCQDENTGTFLYRAPESSSNSIAMSSSADIYSLGIVLLELFSKFKTGMERAVTLANAHKGILPKEIETYPRIKELISKMLNPGKRPSAREVLDIISKRIPNLGRPGEIFTTDISENNRQTSKKLPLFRRWSSNEVVNRPSLTPPTSPLVTTSSTVESTAFSPLSPPPQDTNKIQNAAAEKQRIKELEQQVQMLNKQLQELKTSLAVKDMHISKLNTVSPPLEASDTDKAYFTLPLRRTSARDSLALLGSSPNAKSNSSASLSLIHLISQQQTPSK